MISTGITGNARQDTKPNSASMKRVKTFAGRGAAARADRRARPPHVIGLGGIADHLEREIGFHARAHVEIAVVEQRPAVMRALDAPQIDGDLGFEFGVDRLAEIVPQQHVFGRDGGVGLKLEHPVAVGLLAIEQRVSGGLDALFQYRVAIVGHLPHCCGAERDWGHEGGGALAGSDGTFDRGGQAGICPIAGQERDCCNWSRRPAGARPARRWRQRSRAARARSARAEASAAARSTLATSLQIFCASDSRGVSMSRSAALMVTESRPGKANIHSVVALSTPRIGG